MNGPGDTPVAHDLHAFLCDVNSGDVEASALQLQRVQAGAGADVEDAPMAEIQRRPLKRIDVGPQPIGCGNIVPLAVLVAGQYGVAIATIAIEQRHPMEMIGVVHGVPH